MPHQPLKMHRHDCGGIIVGLQGGTLTKIEETEETSDEPIEVMVIELKALDTKNSFNGS